jgi:protein-S-isoprenylcysteine O-methyltransferase Ste14
MTMMLKQLVGSGDRIGLLVLPILLGGVLLNVAFPAPFSVGGPSEALRALSVAVLVVGITIWAWSVALILIHVPRGELITSGPFALVKHPLYTSVAFLVLPWLGFLLDTWLGVVLGAALYVGVRMFAREEEEDLANRFGASWDSYARRVLVPWV